MENLRYQIWCNIPSVWAETDAIQGEWGSKFLLAKDHKCVFVTSCPFTHWVRDNSMC